MRLHELLHESALAALPLMNTATGSMQGGHNGPYNHPETPVRNTCHWMMTFLKVHEVTGDQRFLDAAGRALRYVTSVEARPGKATFWHRATPGKDKCNGLIGQAWTIEALLAASRAFNRPDLVHLSEELFLLHPFDESHCVWFPVETDGSALPLDTTFNHQLWFAAAGGLVAAQRGGEADRRVRKFLDHLPANLDLLPNGLIWHPLALKASPWERSLEFAGRARQMLKPQSDRYLKAVGYHTFNLYGFGLLKREYADHQFWQSRKFRRLWRHANSPAFRRSLESNKYGYPYNPPGIEMAFALEVFGAKDGRREQEEWLSGQFQRSYDRRSRMMNRGTQDPVTYAARLYEATRLPDMECTLPSH